MIDRSSGIPLYIQIRDDIKEKILSGEYSSGSMLPAEADFHTTFNVSRHTLRRALKELEVEGYINRTRRKGTFVNGKKDYINTEQKLNHIGLIMPRLAGKVNIGILNGYLKVANEYGYTVNINISEEDIDKEIVCLNAMVKSGVKAITIYPAKGSCINDKIIHQVNSAGVDISLIDHITQNINVDYVGCDNRGGGYTAARHISLQNLCGSV